MADLTDDECKLIKLYEDALYALATDDNRWISNYNIYTAWTTSKRFVYVCGIERDAASDTSTKMSRTLITKAMFIRMTQ